MFRGIVLRTLDSDKDSSSLVEKSCSFLPLLRTQVLEVQVLYAIQIGHRSSRSVHGLVLSTNSKNREQKGNRTKYLLHLESPILS